MDRTATKAVYAKRARQRAAHQPGGAPQRNTDAEEQPAPAPQADAFGEMAIYSCMHETKASNATLDAAAIYAKRRARRATVQPGSGDSEE